MGKKKLKFGKNTCKHLPTSNTQTGKFFKTLLFTDTYFRAYNPVDKYMSTFTSSWRNQFFPEISLWCYKCFLLGFFIRNNLQKRRHYLRRRHLVRNIKLIYIFRLYIGTLVYRSAQQKKIEKNGALLFHGCGTPFSEFYHSKNRGKRSYVL